MKKIYLLLSMLFALQTGGQTQTLTIPETYATTLTGSSFIGPLANTARTYQLLIHESELSALAGHELTGISFRSPVALSTSTSWPLATTTYNNYDIYLSESVLPANRSLVFADNVVGTQLQVRSGPLVIAPGSYPAGGPASFGTSITFNTPYLYNGGNLLLEIRHGGSNGDGRSTDAVPFNNALFNSVLATAYATNYTATSNAFGVGGAVVVRFDYNTALPISLHHFYGKPEATENKLYWETSAESRCAYFGIEKATDGHSFTTLAVVPAHDNDAKGAYIYADNAIGSAKTYYRLKMIDRDQVCTYSGIIEVNRGPAAADGVIISPNPFKDRLSVSIEVPEAGAVHIRLYDLWGRVHCQYKELLLPGSNHVTVPAAALPSGWYILEIKGAANRVARVRKW